MMSRLMLSRAWIFYLPNILWGWESGTGVDCNVFVGKACVGCCYVERVALQLAFELVCLGGRSDVPNAGVGTCSLQSKGFCAVAVGGEYEVAFPCKGELRLVACSDVVEVSGDS